MADRINGGVKESNPTGTMMVPLPFLCTLVLKFTSSWQAGIRGGSHQERIWNRLVAA